MKPRKHHMSMTYPPKLEAFRDGTCIQTIRKGDKVSAGDLIEFHEWEDIAYHSKWCRRKTITVSEVIPIILNKQGIRLPDGSFHSWASDYANLVAEWDHISPPTGTELYNVLFKIKAPEGDVKCQIIRWGSVINNQME